MGTALMMVPVEEAITWSGGSRSRKHRKPGTRWNCGGRGHRRDACASPDMVISDQERSIRMCQSDSEESEWNAPGSSCSDSSSERSRSRSRDLDMSAAPLEEDSNDAGGISVLAIEAVIELSTYKAIDEVNDPDVVEMLGEWQMLKSLMKTNLKGIYIVVIPTELKAEEVGVPAEEPCSLDDSSTVFEKSLKLPELANDLEGCISLDASCLGSLESGWADEPKRTVMRSRHEYWIQGEYAIVVGMEKQLNEELNILGQHTLKEPTTDAQAMEGTRSIAFNTKACPGDAKEDPGGLPIDKFSFVWFEDIEHDIYRRECGTINDEEIFKVIEETDLLVTGLIMDESRGSMGLEGLNPDSISVEKVLRRSSGVVAVTESVWDVGWRWPA
ncbi:hypothetical protein F5887DRAFT_924997 [Amanita rubescens]|nr:hypothetical protein F5887DRAFT_924997 [Amanita rubescens]